MQELFFILTFFTHAASTMPERILVVAGDPNTGKSTQLRAMFLDPRLGSKSRSLRQCEVEVADERCNANDSHPRESGDPVNADAGDYWMPACAGMTGENKFGRGRPQCRSITNSSWP